MRNLWAARPPASVERVRPRAVRRVAPAVIALLVGAALVPGAVGAQTDEDAARRAAAEIQAARDRANAAADAYFRAESDLDQLEDDLAALEQEAVQLGETVDALRAEVENVALARFVNSGTGGIPLLTGLDEPQDQVQAEVFVDVLTNTGSDALDQYDVARQELADAEDELDRRRAQLEDERAEHARLRDAALAEVERLREVEEQRLRDEAVRLALEAQQAEERARLEEIARQEAEAAARAQPNPGASETTAAPATPATTSADPGADSSGSGSDGSSDDSTETTPSTAAPATAAPSGGASGGTSGGRTGSDGSGSQPSGATTSGGYLDNIVCPISGSAYSDTYGAPRSGGRSHQGVDMLAPHGVPIVAVTNGSVSFSNNSLGGLAAWLRGDNGTSYYYAHMSSFAGSSRRVSAGEVIAYNGSTGNANGVPHLHFEVRPGGGLAINPTPTVRAAGC